MVEQLIGFARRNFLVPVPENSSLEVLNTQLMERCVTDRAERTRGKTGAKEELLREDQPAFLHLPKPTFEARRVVQRTADSQSLIRFDDIPAGAYFIFDCRVLVQNVECHMAKAGRHFGAVPRRMRLAFSVKVTSST